MEEIIVETKHIDDQGRTCVSNCDSDSIAEIRHSGQSSISVSDQSTVRVETSFRPPQDELIFETLMPRH
jgi:hypothetical protein